MNSALVKEVEIAGVEIWKAVEDINKVYLTKECEYTIVDYIFISLYQAAQGTERLLKIIVELIVYINKNDEKQKTDDLLHGHNHIALVDYIAMKGVIKFDLYQENLYKALLEFENAKKEILWYLICNGHNIKVRYLGINIPPLSFAGPGINTFITEMIKNKLCETDIHSHISEEYNELRSKGRDKLKERVEFLNYLFSDDRVCDHFLKDDGWGEC